eukprot:SAG11_NODE_33920_length_274_cov_2.377143_1_plen_43_part_10
MYFLSVLYREARCTVYVAYVIFGTITRVIPIFMRVIGIPFSKL